MDLFSLEAEAKWEGIVSFKPNKVGDSQKVDFLLYKNSDIKPYLKLHILVDVRE